jgi:AcrR family transcriptional regulator
MSPDANINVQSRILDAAELLFGSDGLQASIRDITKAAKANLAAIHYHFGSKESLVAAVLERRAGPVNDGRLKLLTQFERQAGEGPVPVEEILQAFVAPTLEMLKENPQALKFIARLLTDPDPKVREIMAARFGEVARRFHRALCKALPNLPPREVALRMTFFIGSMVHTWVHQNDIVHFLGGAAAEENGGLLEPMIRYGAAGMRS